MTPRERRVAQSRKAGLANKTKWKAGDPRACAAAAKMLAAGHGLKDGDPRNKAMGRAGGLKAAAKRAATPGTPDYRNREILLLRGLAALQRDRVAWAYRNRRRLTPRRVILSLGSSNLRVLVSAQLESMITG